MTMPKAVTPSFQLSYRKPEMETGDPKKLTPLTWCCFGTPFNCICRKHFWEPIQAKSVLYVSVVHLASMWCCAVLSTFFSAWSISRPASPCQILPAVLGLLPYLGEQPAVLPVHLRRRKSILNKMLQLVLGKNICKVIPY